MEKEDAIKLSGGLVLLGLLIWLIIHFVKSEG